MKQKLSEKGEAYLLIGAVTDMMIRFLGDFTKYCVSKGAIEMEKESPKYIVTMRLERKKEAK